MKTSCLNRQTPLGLSVALLACLSMPQTALCQTEKFGIVSYTPPAGWTKTAKEDRVAFSVLNQSTGGFCIITIFGATPSSGSPQNDFQSAWNALVVKPFQAEANPTTQTDSEDGWTAVIGGAGIDFQGNKALVSLTVYSGFGKSVSVLGVLNDQSYLPPLQAFVVGITLDKTASPAPPAAAPDSRTGKPGSMTYAKPEGWSEQVFQDGVLFKPLDLPAGEHLSMQIMPPLNGSGTLEQALALSYDEAAAMYKGAKMRYAGGGNYEKTEPRKSFNGWEYIRGRGGIQVENGTPYPSELGLELFVVKLNNRFERVAILETRKSCNLSRYYTSERRSYRNGIEELLFSLRFPEFDGQALREGSANGAGIVGVWQGISLSVGAPSVGEPVGVRYKVFSPIFLSNGQAHFGPKFLIDGLDGMDRRIPAELYRRDWGTYSFSNGRGVLKMPYADIPLRMDGDKLVITANQTDHRFFKLAPVDGATFDGTYTLSGVNGQTPTITFTSDGRFADNGALRVLYHEYVDCLNPALNPGSGRYEVKDFSVIFTYTDGRRFRIAFLGVGYDRSNPRPATLTMSSNEDPLTRR